MILRCRWIRFTTEDVSWEKKSPPGHAAQLLGCRSVASGQRGSLITVDMYNSVAKPCCKWGSHVLAESQVVLWFSPHSSEHSFFSSRSILEVGGWVWSLDRWVGLITRPGSLPSCSSAVHPVHPHSRSTILHYFPKANGVSSRTCHVEFPGSILVRCNAIQWSRREIMAKRKT